MSESSWPDAATIRDATRSTRYHSTQATLWANLIQLLCPCPPNTPGTRAYTCTTQQGIQKGRDQPPCPGEQTRRKHELSNSASTRILQTTYIHMYVRTINSSTCGGCDVHPYLTMCSSAGKSGVWGNRRLPTAHPSARSMLRLVLHQLM